jgi:hypothetical protein
LKVAARALPVFGTIDFSISIEFPTLVDGTIRWILIACLPKERLAQLPAAGSPFMALLSIH